MTITKLTFWASHPRFIHIYRHTHTNIVLTQAAHFLASWQPFWSCGINQDVLNIGIILDPQRLPRILLITVITNHTQNCHSLYSKPPKWICIWACGSKCPQLTQKTQSWLGRKDKSPNSRAAIGRAVVHAICCPSRPLSEPAVVQ